MIDIYNYTSIQIKNHRVIKVSSPLLPRLSPFSYLVAFASVVVDSTMHYSLSCDHVPSSSLVDIQRYSNIPTRLYIYILKLSFIQA